MKKTTWVTLLMSFIIPALSFSQNVGIGTTTPTAKLHIRGSSDISQLFIDANSTQSADQPLLKLRNSSGADLLWMHSDNAANTFVGLNTGRFNNATGGATGNSFFGSLAADSNTIGANNTVVGREALFSNKAGDNATAIGYQAMQYTNSTTGSFSNTNIAVGYQALRGSTTAGSNTGTGNTAIGYQSMLNNSTGFNNTAYGRNALLSNTGGDNNTALGYQSLNDNTTGLNNTATGFQSLYNNADGDRNTAYGTSALLSNVAGNNGTAFGNGAMSLSNNQGSSFTNTSVAFGYEALRGSVSASANTGTGNSAIGYQSLRNNSSGDDNTAMGYNSLITNSTGSANSTVGYLSLGDNSTGSQNTAIGWQALRNNTTADSNTVMGARAMLDNTTGSRNVAIGTNTLLETVAGSNGTAIGYNAMGNYNNTATPFTNFNVAVGYGALFGEPNNAASINTGNNNTAVGYLSLYSNGSGDNNTAIGKEALYNNSNGSFNTSVGMFSLLNNYGSDRNTAVGYSAGSAFVNADDCTFIGYNSESNAPLNFNQTAIGSGAIVTGFDRVRVGNTNVTSIGGQVGWTTFSDGRFKKNIDENIPGLDFILKLRPVSYTTDITALNQFIGVDEIRKIKESRGEKFAVAKPGYQETIRHSGFIAQEVESAAKQLGFPFSGIDIPTNDKSPYGIRYAEFVVPLVKAVQEQQKIIEAQNKRNNEQQTQLDNLSKEIELLKAKLK
ncbi:MAG: hypothetical protein HOP10_10145 [Chitinophagaceae bacterium]|nr:hypothetical protein [Chitinophagaceae bacterium]